MSFIDKIMFWKKDPLSEFSSSSSNDVPLPPLDGQQGQDPSTLPNPYQNGPEPLATATDPLTPNPSGGLSDKYAPPQENTGLREQTNQQAFSQPSQNNTPTSSFQSGSTGMGSMNIDQLHENKDAIGKSLARKYMYEQEQNQQSQQQNASQQSQRSPENGTELLNLKIDAMKSDLSLANKRLEKIEQLLEMQMQKKRW